VTSDRKPPGAAFWATVVVVVALVAYPLSFGPACWWFSQPANDFTPLSYDVDNAHPFDLWPRAPRAYWPLGWIAAIGPRAISRPLRSYATACGQRPVALPCDWQGTRDEEFHFSRSPGMSGRRGRKRKQDARKGAKTQSKKKEPRFATPWRWLSSPRRG
jgi:hypothetical protein